MKRRLAIGIVCYPSVGGSGIVATQLGVELAKLGHRVHFISYEPPFRLIKKSPNIFFHKVDINEYGLFKYPDYTLPLAVRIGAVHQKYGLDILHVHYAVPHATAALLACQMLEQIGLKRIPKIITTLHGTDITLLARDPNLLAIIKYSVEQSSGVTAVSRSLKLDTTKVLSTRKNIRVIHNFFSPRPVSRSREQMRKLLKVREGTFLAVHLSNLRPVKRIPDLLRIVAAIKNEDFKLLMLAGGSFDEYSQLARKLKIEDRLLIRHNVIDIGNYINAADAGIYTSESESFGMGLLETMAYGKPVVATRVGGIPEVAQDGKTGFLRPVGDVAGFASGLWQLIHNPDLRLRLGAQAGARAAKSFSSNAIVAEYLDYYRQILDK